MVAGGGADCGANTGSVGQQKEAVAGWAGCSPLGVPPALVRVLSQPPELVV